MGKTSKFLFPVPGRKHAATKEIERVRAQSPAVLPSRLSKAQRILGTEGHLNIDSPTRDDDLSWRYPSSRSSDMSISISESTQSTQSTNDTGSFQGSGSELVNHDSGVVSKPRLRGKASSTLLGQKNGEDTETDSSSMSRRMRHEDSSSTLKSYYDRQKSPLAISQQTSASSARDLALRKGLPPVVLDLPTSPLLQVVSSAGDFEENFVHSIRNGGNESRDKSSRKKPLRLDLSLLFPSLSRRASKIQLTPPSTSTNGPHTLESQHPTSGPQKLTKAQSRESLRQQHPVVRPTKSYDRLNRQTTDTLSNLYESYEQQILSPHLGQIPESTVADREQRLLTGGKPANVQPRPQPVWTVKEPPRIPPRRINTREQETQLGRDSHVRRKIDFHSQSEQSPTNVQDPTVSADEEPHSWTQVRESMISPPWDSSAASVSSKNTKTSRHTSASAFSNSDLKQNSVLSLSSDSEEEESDRESVTSPADSSSEIPFRVLNGGAQRSIDSRHLPSRQSAQASSRRQSTRKGAAQVSPFLTIPETSPASSRLSGPWSLPNIDNFQPATGSLKKTEKRPKRVPSTSSKRSSNQPTPPVSPNPAALREVPDSSRFMALTEQEAALVAALRNKKAKMRERIIQEHETAKSPPPEPDRKLSRDSKKSSFSSSREANARQEKHRILLYLDTPLHDGHTISTAEPSPDLSDFLSFASDEEDSTPRTSYVPPKKGQPRPDSNVVSPADPQDHKRSPPPSVARLSAVGASSGFRKERSSQDSLPEKRSTNTGARFSDSSKKGRRKDFLLEENEERDIIWGMKSNEGGSEMLL